MNNNLKKATNNVSEWYENTATDNITTTYDKLVNILKEFKQKISNKYKFFGSLSFTITIFISLSTSDFKDYILPKGVWQGCFYILFFLGVCYLIVHLIKLIIYSNATNIDVVIDSIKSPTKKIKPFCWIFKPIESKIK